MGRSAVRFPKPETKNRRMITELNEGWKTWLIDNSQLTIDNSKGNHQSPIINCQIPHNWDDYYGYRQLTHGNLHGTTMYVKDFSLDNCPLSTFNSQLKKRYFLRFEGVVVRVGIQRRSSAVRYIPSGGAGGNRRDPY